VLIDRPGGIEQLRSYYEGYFAIAREHGAGMVLDTPTWRANRDWGERLGYDRGGLADANRRWADVIAGMRAGWGHDRPVVLGGSIGPRGDGYVPGATMSVGEAADYHAEQVATFAATDVDMVTAMTLNYVEEAVGVARAAAAHDMPAAISFTVETDGRLPSGQPLGEAIEQVDADPCPGPAYFMVNCAHPDHLGPVLEAGDGAWRERIVGIRANASRMSHAELDAMEQLDEGDPGELADGYARLREALPNLTVLGGCCGTDDRHVAAICARLSA
jgi:homocysteine S-methyltransferase